MDGVRPRRRYPNFVAFIATGTILGMIAGALISTLSGNPARNFTENAAMGYMAVTFGVIGAILGGLAGVLAEMFFTRRDNR